MFADAILDGFRPEKSGRVKASPSRLKVSIAAMAPISPKHVLAAPIIDFPHGTILIPAVTPAAELSAAEQRNKRTGAHYLWARPPAVESAKAAVRVSFRSSGR